MEKKERKSFREVLGMAGYALYCLILAALLVIAIAVLVQTVRLDCTPARLWLHWNLVIGFAAFFALFIIPRVRSNTRWMMSFTHEFTHLVFALLFFRKIHRFKVDAKDSHVSYSGGWYGYIPITLAPYCVPLFTLALLPWRFTTGNPYYLAAIDILIGFSYAFHICCWLKQTRLHQTDIIGPGVVRSLLVIALFHILNFCLVVLTPSSGVELAIKRVFREFPAAFVTGLDSLI